MMRVCLKACITLLTILIASLVVAEEKPVANNSTSSQAGARVTDTAKAAAPADQHLQPSPELRQAEHVDLKQLVTEPLATPLPGDVLPAESISAVPESVTTPIPDAAAQPESAQPIDQLPQAADIAASPQTPLIMLNSEVAPGTATRLSWTPNVSFMGIAAPSAVLVVHGVKPGPRVCLTAAIHGDELNGIEVVRHVLYSIDPEELAGTVIGVPIVNLQGFRRSSRYLPDRRDLNRYFPGNGNGSSASRIARSLFDQVISHCDLLVDMHTGSFHRTNLPQLRANLLDPEVASLSRKMGSIVVVHSVGREGCLRRAATDAGIPAVTLEAGQPHQLQKSAVEHGVKSVETLLDSLGMLDRRPFWQFKSEPVYYRSRWVRATAGGILFSDVDLGAQVKTGDLLGVITDPITNGRQEILAPYDGRVIGMALNQVMYPGFAAYHIGLQASVDTAGEHGHEGDVGDEDGNLDDQPAPIDSSEMDDQLLEDS